MAAFPEMLELRVECGARRSRYVVLVSQQKRQLAVALQKRHWLPRSAKASAEIFLVFWRNAG